MIEQLFLCLALRFTFGFSMNKDIFLPCIIIIIDYDFLLLLLLFIITTVNIAGKVAVNDKNYGINTEIYIHFCYKIC